tara:strand:+ start:381 stop:1265 length:885 start_codon:yes stop_codon:yes gene_type:complete
MADPVGSELAATESVSPYAAPYVTEMLGRGQALAATPYQPYTGPLTAGPSALQTQAFGGLASLGVPPAGMAGSFTGVAPQIPTAQSLVDSGGQLPDMGMPTSPIQQYMNPFLEAALQPQLQGIMRDAQIAQNELASQYAKAGAFGGSRQAVADAELARGALDRMAATRGQGYAQAFDRAADLFGEDRRFGMDVLDAQRQAGTQQRAIEQAGIEADMAQFREERDDPFKKVQYMQSLLQGLPIEAVRRDYIEPSGISQLLSDLGLAGAAFGSFADPIAGLIKAMGDDDDNASPSG